ncbi:MAG TPA: beta-ketoacyl-ACP synthase III [Burkholderiales bacterium]|nr:beta-ketoacyl-ACP synthase III [Burkholderiales bacterium]
MYSRIAGCGSYLPEKIITNHDLEAIVDTSDAWIFSRTGIRQRRIAAENEKASDLAFHASRKAMQAAHVRSDDIDLIIVATSTPDMIFPSTACILQAKLGIKTCAAFDIQAVCSGFVYALATADLFIRSGKSRCGLVVGAEVYSRILDWSDRGTCVLFGDGAGAVVVNQSNVPGIISTHLHADGSYHQQLAVPGSIADGKVTGNPHVVMDGNAVFKFAVKVMSEMVDETLAANNLKKSDVSWLIPHQANIRIIQATAKKLGLSMDRVIVTVDRHANTSSASIPLALDDAVKDGRIKAGELILMEAVGGGFTWGSVLLRW